MRESGTCNVCSAPCSSCMHYDLSLSAIDSISESGFSSSLCNGKKAKSSFFNVDSMPISKVRICDDLHNAETSNFLSTSSSRDSYSEIAESKTNLRVSIANEVLSSRENFEQGPRMRKSDQDCTTSCVHLSTDMCQRFHSGLGEEHCESECHGDSILLTCGGTDAKVTARDGMVDIKEEDIACSNVAISSFMKVNSPAVPGCGFQECETGENHWRSSGSNASINATSLDSNSYSASGCTAASVKPQNPLCRDDVSSKICSLRSMSQAETSSCLNYGSKDIQGIVNLQPKEEITAFSEVDNVESSLASLPSRSFSEHRSSFFTKHEDQKSILFSSHNSNMNDTDLDKQFDNDLKGSNVHEPLKKDAAVLSATNSQDDHLQPLLVSEGGLSESDTVLYDVKVCDICGDAGREDLLATCSRCNDGAEHTYCMQEKMDKVPDGDWLCEECKIKTENRDADLSEAASVRLKPLCSNAINQNSMNTFIPRKRPKLVERTTGLDVQGQSKGLQRSNTLTRGKVNHLQEAKSLDVCHSAEITSPMKKPILSSQASLKIRDSGKLKTAIAAPLPEVWSAEVSEAISLSKTFFRSSSFNSQPSLHSPHGNVLRSVSFSKLNLNPKVKNNIENDPGKQKITTGNDLREQVSRNSLTKFTSFKSTNLWGPNTESGSNGLFHPSHIGEIKRPKELQERKVVEKKSFSAVGDSFFTSSPGIAINSIPNVDSKFLLSGYKSNLSETGSRCSSKGSDDTSHFGSDGGKKQITYSSKISGSANGISRLNKAQKSKVLEEDIHTSMLSGDESCSMADIESQCTVLLPTVFAQNRRTGSTMLVSSRTSAREDNRTIHCNRCNGTEHATQHCSVDKVGESSHKHASDWNSREVVTGHKICREAVVTSRNRESKNNKTDVTEELPAVTVDLLSDVPSNFTPPGSRQIDVPLVIERRNDKNSSENLDVHLVKPIEVTNLDQQLEISFEAPLVPKTAIYNDSATVAEATRAETSVLVKTYCAFTFPKLEYIWQGSFNVLGTRSLHEMFHGIQAHISTCASHKVFEVATKLPNNIQLDEISYSSLWKAQCQVTTPQEENIGLFFFAKDIDSYERSYTKLLEKMRRNDTALRGNIDGTELLVFLSNKLSLSSQRWNSMHYLWGMFRVKKRNSIPLMGEEKPSLPNLNVNLISDDLSITCIERVHSSTKNSEGCLKLSKLPESSTPSSIPGDSTGVDTLHSIASNIEDTIRGKIGPSLVWNCSNQDAEHLKVSVKHVSSPVGGLSRTTAMPLVVESRLQNATPEAGSKEENVGTCQKKLINDCTHREAADLLALPYINAESNLTPMPAGAECSEIDAKMEDNKCSSSAVCRTDNNPKASVLQRDYLSNESNNSRKHSRPCSMERSSQPHVFTDDTDEMERLKKTCNTFGSTILDYNLSPQFSPKVKQFYSSICSQQEQGECSYSEPLFPRNTATAERCFFPLDMGLLKSTKSSDANTPQLSTPDLELALGNKSRLTKSAAKPFLSFTGGNQHLEEPGSTGDDGGDVSASLSLSLSLS